MMVADGYAWHYIRYAPDNKELADAEKHARQKKLWL
jgi:endonuclease YncB( thermonuclease family)